MENLSLVLTLMAVGMGTVFLILLFIIFFSQQLIKIINRYFPEEQAKAITKKVEKTSAVSPKVVAAITTAINQSTGGKMKVSKIEKL